MNRISSLLKSNFGIHLADIIVVSLTIVTLGINPSAARGSTLVSVDLNSPDDGLLTLDTATGLKWLDLTQTDLELSYNQMLVQLGPGGTFEGFRHATEAEVVTISTNADIDAAAFEIVNLAPVTNFQALVGITDIGIGNLNDSFGLTPSVLGPSTCGQPCRRGFSHAASFRGTLMAKPLSFLIRGPSTILV